MIHRLLITLATLALLIGATWLGIKNYLMTKSISNYWLIFSFATVSFAFIWILILLQLVGISPQILAEIQESLIMTWSALLLVLALEIASSYDTVTIK